MRRYLFLSSVVALFVAEIIALIVFACVTTETRQDAVAVNEVAQTVAVDFADMRNHKNKTSLDYTVIDSDGNVIYRTRSGLSETLTEAIAHRDTIIDAEVNGETVGKIIIYNTSSSVAVARRRAVIIFIAAAVVAQLGLCAAYFYYVRCTIVKPFYGLKGFAERVAGGNLDIPLEMDRQNVFGAFTESFDLMRSELKKARIAEARANASKKELVAKLSHDIKTPIASIKAVAEVGAAQSSDDRDCERYARITEKADLVNALVSNLFTATLEELDKLTVSPADIDSADLVALIQNADYKRRATLPEIPSVMVVADKLRLQQVFDNVFANSYKYADTPVSLTAELRDGRLNIAAEDEGGGVAAEELPRLKEKFMRGGNCAGIDGAGLGLYISDRFMTEMHGALIIENGDRGLRVTVSLATSGANLRNN